MKKLTIILLGCFLLLATGCKSNPNPITQNSESSLKPQIIKPEAQYLRIDVGSETLDEDLERHIDTNTLVTITAESNLPKHLPVYEITKHNVTEQEFHQLKEQLVVPESASSSHGLKLDGNRVYGQFANHGTGTVTMTDEELEAQARKTLSQIPFLEGEYVYYGICGSETLEDSEGVHTTRVRVAFCRVLDGMRIIANDRCDMWFNDSGLVGITIDLFDYEQIGTMDVVLPEDAEAKIKTPDAFTLESESGNASTVETLNVDTITSLWVNQQSRGCTILQPLYIYSGTAALEDGTEAKFSSEIIAIPETYTYEEE